MIVAPVADDPDKTPRGKLRALYDWMRGAPTPPAPAAATTSGGPAATPRPDGLPAKIGHYTIARKLGEGGMGVVYAARDERLERTVALKTMSSLAQDETARRRFWREARAAASVNHPNVCQLYEIGEDAGELFIAMELLAGEPLSDRIAKGALAVTDALPIGLGILAALQALHERGVVHRDLKPSNVFLTPHGVKLLDFGLARPSDPELARSLSSEGALTRTGMLVGTPRYMAPEQVTGDEVDARTDLFATGAILFEMLAARPAFGGKSVVEVLHGTMYEQPPALSGSPAIAAVDRVIRRALAKKPAERPASAAEMAEELRALAGLAGADDRPALARPLTRIVVLPFRVLRADPETDFLAFSLPDAIATSLSSIGPLVVRSSATAARFGGDAPDLKALAAEADVDRVVMGTLLRAGDQLRITAQLVEAPGGTLVAAHTVQSSLGDLFRLQDDLARRVVQALALPLGGGDASPTPYAPHDARAYELYLRGNEAARTYAQIKIARELYERCLDLDPNFAPAWAQIGRCHRIIGKYVEVSPDSEVRAEEAFRRALQINPRLSVAHKYYAQLEADLGRGEAGLVRLLGEADRHGNDPELFAGLVHVGRYCGLNQEAIAAHHEARRLDPNVATSLPQTMLMLDVERVLDLEMPPLIAGADDGVWVLALGLAGRLDEARAGVARMRESSRVTTFQFWMGYLTAWLDRRVQEMLESYRTLAGLKIIDDPEAIFQEGWLLCDAGAHEEGLPRLERAVEKGYYVTDTLANARAFDALRGDARFTALVGRAEASRRRAAAAFLAAGGERLLGRARGAA
jgi:serine/threonine protein kinase/tetratricopeptide (TPR) repeat protein